MNRKTRDLLLAAGSLTILTLTYFDITKRIIDTFYSGPGMYGEFREDKGEVGSFLEGDNGELVIGINPTNFCVLRSEGEESITSFSDLELHLRDENYSVRYDTSSVARHNLLIPEKERSIRVLVDTPVLLVPGASRR